MQLNFFIFATPSCDSTRDSHLQLHFATTLATTLATHVRDSTRDSCSRLHSLLMFATHICDLLSHPQSRLAISATSLSRNSTTDGWTVLTPQCNLPSVPTLTLITMLLWNLLPGLASTSSYCPPSCPPPLVALCLLTHPLAHHLLQRPLPPLPGPLPTSPPLSHPLPLPPFPLSGKMSLMF